MNDAFSFGFAKLSDDGFDPEEKQALDPFQRLIVVPCSGLTGIADDETSGVDHDEGKLSEHSWGTHFLGERVDHHADRSPEGDIAHRLCFDEEDFGDEDVTARELVHEVIEERDVLCLQGMTAWRQNANDPAIFEEHGRFIRIHSQLGPKGDVLVWVFINNETFFLVGAGDHHLFDATLHEIHDPHALPPGR
ncbi:MAG: hypothetical protein BWY17_04938 [Deltaproteobacteria bacterium ADurb.Bin207]|nr:MAG: hypothetical protein BWY17_04938 [Deltaproteobacteria bacterium ADurb.Bin207]